MAVGVGLGLLLHLTQQPQLMLAGVAVGVWLVRDSPPSLYRLLPIVGGGLIPVMFIGLSQLLYVVPALIVLVTAGRMRLAGGVLLAALATAAVNALVYVLSGGRPLR